MKVFAAIFIFLCTSIVFAADDEVFTFFDDETQLLEEMPEDFLFEDKDAPSDEAAGVKKNEQKSDIKNEDKSDANEVDGESEDPEKNFSVKSSAGIGKFVAINPLWSNSRLIFGGNYFATLGALKNAVPYGYTFGLAYERGLDDIDFLRWMHGGQRMPYFPGIVAEVNFANFNKTPVRIYGVSATAGLVFKVGISRTYPGRFFLNGQVGLMFESLQIRKLPVKQYIPFVASTAIGYEHHLGRLIFKLGGSAFLIYDETKPYWSLGGTGSVAFVLFD